MQGGIDADFRGYKLMNRVRVRALRDGRGKRAGWENSMYEKSPGRSRRHPFPITVIAY